LSVDVASWNGAGEPAGIAADLWNFKIEAQSKVDLILTMETYDASVTNFQSYIQVMLNDGISASKLAVGFLTYSQNDPGLTQEFEIAESDNIPAVMVWPSYGAFLTNVYWGNMTDFLNGPQSTSTTTTTTTITTSSSTSKSVSSTSTTSTSTSPPTCRYQSSGGADGSGWWCWTANTATLTNAGLSADLLGTASWFGVCLGTLEEDNGYSSNQVIGTGEVLAIPNGSGCPASGSVVPSPTVAPGAYLSELLTMPLLFTLFYVTLCPKRFELMLGSIGVRIKNSCDQVIF
jgi:hypothetical protein